MTVRTLKFYAKDLAGNKEQVKTEAYNLVAPPISVLVHLLNLANDSYSTIYGYVDTWQILDETNNVPAFTQYPNYKTTIFRPLAAPESGYALNVERELFSNATFFTYYTTPRPFSLVCRIRDKVSNVILKDINLIAP